MPPHFLRTRGVRWNKDTQCFEMWCPGCEVKRGSPTFWPLTTEFWDTRVGLVRCRACNEERKRLAEKNRKASKREEFIAKNRAYYANNRELLRWKDNERKAQRRAAAATSPSAPA